MMGLGKVLGRLLSLTAVAALVTAALLSVLAMAGPVESPILAARIDGAPSDSADRGLAHLLGISGHLRAVTVVPDGPRPSAFSAPDGAPVNILSLVPLSAKLGATWRGYRIGFWPGERATRNRARYQLPAGFLEVTPDNEDVALSTHFRVRDFLTHDQEGTWPKVLVIQLPLLDKLELISEALVRLGRTPALHVMSGFRTPQYNALGVGPLGGRARDSRHMYGDAADIFVDADGDGRMDDLNGDGRVDINDARWLAAVAEDVEAVHPEVTGGIGVYRANSMHGPFVHVDTRGFRARW
jgi:Peptidase M15